MNITKCPKKGNKRINRAKVVEDLFYYYEFLVFNGEGSGSKKVTVETADLILPLSTNNCHF